MKYPKGSMAEADAKSSKRFFIGAAVVIAVIMSMIYFNFPSTFLHTVYYVRASGLSHVLSVFAFAACYVFILVGSGILWEEKSGGNYTIITLGSLALAIALSAGFNFSL